MKGVLPSRNVTKDVGRGPPNVLELYSTSLDIPHGLLILGPNDSSINRGDREDTGDNEARPTEKGSGPAHQTVDDTAFGGSTSIRHPSSGNFDLEQEREDFDGIEIMEADDGRLGITNVGDVPADDWAADTGETKTPDGER
jgi:hypothetical protein